MLKAHLLRIYKNKSVLNILLKIISIGPKFILSFFIAKKMSFDEFGKYTLFTTTVLIISTLIGLEYHNSSNRKILKEKSELKNNIFSVQISFYILLYIFLLLPITIILVKINFISYNLFWLFLLIVATEHFSMELFRLLVIFEKPVIASISMFLRTGFWSILVITVLQFSSFIELSDSSWIYWFWLMGSIISILFALPFLHLKYNPKVFLNFKIKVFIKDIKSGLVFFMITLSAKVIETFGRYFMDYFETKELVGIFSIFFQISNIINVVIFSGLFVFYLPIVLKSYQEKISTLESIYTFRLKVLRMSIILSLAIFLISPLLLKYFSNELLLKYIWVLVILVFSQLFLNLFYTSYLQLYASKNDKSILYVYMWSTLTQVAVALIFQLFVSPIYALAFAVLIGNLTLYILGILAVGRKKREEQKK